MPALGDVHLTEPYVLGPETPQLLYGSRIEPTWMPEELLAELLCEVCEMMVVVMVVMQSLILRSLAATWP